MNSLNNVYTCIIFCYLYSLQGLILSAKPTIASSLVTDNNNDNVAENATQSTLIRAFMLLETIMKAAGPLYANIDVKVWKKQAEVAVKGGIAELAKWNEKNRKA